MAASVGKNHPMQWKTNCFPLQDEYPCKELSLPEIQDFRTHCNVCLCSHEGIPARTFRQILGSKNGSQEGCHLSLAVLAHLQYTAAVLSDLNSLA